MVFYQSMVIRDIGGSRGVYLPKIWGFKKGDWVHVEMVVAGRPFHHTTKVGFNDSAYIRIPKFWGLEKGDIVDTRINLSAVPEAYRKKDADSGTEN